MIKLYPLTFLLLFAVTSFAQIQFENGYIITTTGERKTCQIKNKDWINTPQTFTYKLTSDGEKIDGSLETIQEFGIEGPKRFIKAKVDIDFSSSDVNSYSQLRAPEFETMEVFLEAIVEGEASLYSYVKPGLKRFFYKTGGNEIQQLVFKEYYAQYGKIAQNKDFITQLRNDVKCTEESENALGKIVYEKKNLEKYFKDYNACKSGTAVVEVKKVKRKAKFNLYLAPGVTYSSMGFNYPPDGVYELPDKISFRLGVEAEVVLGFNKSKWALILEPSYNYYDGARGPVSIDLSYIEFPFGIRHYFYLDKSAIFVNAFFIPGTDIRLKGEISLRDAQLSILEAPSFAGGAGFKRGQLKGEFRICSMKDFLLSYNGWNTEYIRSNVIVSFRLNKS